MKIQTRDVTYDTDTCTKIFESKLIAVRGMTTATMSWQERVEIFAAGDGIFLHLRYIYDYVGFWARFGVRTKQLKFTETVGEVISAAEVAKALARIEIPATKVRQILSPQTA